MSIKKSNPTGYSSPSPQNLSGMWVLLLAITGGEQEPVVLPGTCPRNFCRLTYFNKGIKLFVLPLPWVPASIWLAECFPHSEKHLVPSLPLSLSLWVDCSYSHFFPEGNTLSETIWCWFRNLHDILPQLWCHFFLCLLCSGVNQVFSWYWIRNTEIKQKGVRYTPCLLSIEPHSLTDGRAYS